MLCRTVSVLFLVPYLVNSYKFSDTLGHIKPKTSSDVQRKAVEDLIYRTLSNRSTEFSILVNSSFTVDDKEAFQLKKIENKIQITATTGVAAATGFHYYLKYSCHTHVSWELSQLALPATLPDVDVILTLNDRFRYYQNVCTTSYSFVWWNWQQWERHIDWMAMNSFNFVLAFNGQEAIWQRVYAKLGLTAEDIEEHLSGPAFLSWLRMGNLRGWGGPLSQSWHQRSLDLQRRILARMRAFGIVAILPAFAGHVPRAFQRLYPDTKMTKMSVWNKFPDKYCCPYFLEPTEELFGIVGRLFIEEQMAEFGTDHVYNCDSFNEMDPGNDDLTYLAHVGKSIYGAMTSADPKAVWVMQGWLFVHSYFFWTPSRAKALLTSVPQGKLIVLDLQSEQFPQFTRLAQYYGQPYIWCMLHNFGGTLAMYGSADVINTKVFEARSAANSTMIGTGLTMEGINQNYVIYDLMTEQAWRKRPVELSDWFRSYATRRYGKADVNAQAAWESLKDTLYNFNGLERLRGQFVVTKTPSLDIVPWSWYNYTEVFRALKTLLLASDDLKRSPGYLHDVVDLTRQVLQDNGDIYYEKLVKAFKERDLTQFQRLATVFRGIFLDLESILATNEAFLLGKWLEAAKSCANSTKEEKLFEYNARNQITLWGPWGEIMNYAVKQWSGLVKDFLYPRWDEFVYALNFSLVYNVTFNQPLEQGLIFKLYEEPFTFARDVYPTEPTGDTIEIAKTIASRSWYATAELDSLPNLKTIPVRQRKIPKKYQKVTKRCNLKGVATNSLEVRRGSSKIRDLEVFQYYFAKK